MPSRPKQQSALRCTATFRVWDGIMCRACHRPEAAMGLGKEEIAQTWLAEGGAGAGCELFSRVVQCAGSAFLSLSASCVDLMSYLEASGSIRPNRCSFSSNSCRPSESAMSLQGSVQAADCSTMESLYMHVTRCIFSWVIVATPQLHWRAAQPEGLTVIRVTGAKSLLQVALDSHPQLFSSPGTAGAMLKISITAVYKTAGIGHWQVARYFNRLVCQLSSC